MRIVTVAFVLAPLLDAARAPANIVVTVTRNPTTNAVSVDLAGSLRLPFLPHVDSFALGDVSGMGSSLGRVVNSAANTGLLPVTSELPVGLATWGGAPMGGNGLGFAENELGPALPLSHAADALLLRSPKLLGRFGSPSIGDRPFVITLPDGQTISVNFVVAAIPEVGACLLMLAAGAGAMLVHAARKRSS
jgi:hypothetical protein